MRLRKTMKNLILQTGNTTRSSKENGLVATSQIKYFSPYETDLVFLMFTINWRSHAKKNLTTHCLYYLPTVEINLTNS